MRSRTEVLETAVLGLLNEAPLHGYELRKRLAVALGPFRALSYGSLYPALRRLVERGFIAAAQVNPPSSAPDADRATGEPAASPRDGGTRHGRAGRPGKLGRRGRIVYDVTPDGRRHLHTLLTTAGPATWEDDHFDVRFALFSQTDADTRLRILEGRRTRLAERLEAAREAGRRTPGRSDEYTRELQRFGQERVEHEVDWIDRLIRTERDRVAAARPADPPSPQGNQSKERG